MTKIPLARQLLGLAVGQFQAGLNSVNEALSLMTRPPASRRAPRKSQRMTPALAAKIKVYADNHPKMSVAEIGRTFNVNGGRVSEALRRLK